MAKPISEFGVQHVIEFSFFYSLKIAQLSWTHSTITLLASKFFAQISTTAMQNIFDRPMHKANICTPVNIGSWIVKVFIR